MDTFIWVGALLIGVDLWMYSKHQKHICLRECEQCAHNLSTNLHSIINTTKGTGGRGSLTVQKKEEMKTTIFTWALKNMSIMDEDTIKKMLVISH